MLPVCVLFTILLTCLPLTRPQAHDEEEDDQSDEDYCPGDVDQPPYGGDGHSLHRLGLHQDTMIYLLALGQSPTGSWTNLGNVSLHFLFLSDLSTNSLKKQQLSGLNTICFLFSNV